MLKPKPGGGGGGQPVAPLTYLSRIGALGDSITQYGSYIATSVLGHSASGSMELMAALSGNFDIDIWGSDSNTNPGWNGANNGVAGQTLTTIGDRSPDVNTLAIDALIIGGGTNDNIGVNNYMSAVNAYTGMAAAAKAAGIRHVFIRSIWPKGPSQSVTTTVADQQRYNAALKAYCDANSSWCHYIDIWSATTNPDGTPIAGVLNADDLHPAAYGSLLSVPAYKAAFDAVTDATKTNNRLHDKYWALGGNLLANGAFTGSVAASGTGMSGVLPTGWTASGLTGTTIVASLEANAETGGQSVVLDITPATGTGSEVLTLTPASFTPTANLWYKLWMEFETQGGGLPSIQTSTIGVVSPDNPITAVRTLNGSLPAGQASGKIRAQAPPLQCKATATSLPITISIPKGNAPYRVKLHRVYFGQTSDPHADFGKTVLPANTVAPSLSVSTGAVGTPIVVNPGTWSGLNTATGVNGQAFKYALYRDGIFVSNTYAAGALSYTPVAADGGSTLTWTVAASNMAQGRSTPVAVPGSVAIANPSWKAEFDYVADTHKTAGTQDGNSTSLLTVTRSSTGYDNLFTTLFAANTARRTAAGLLSEPAYSFNSRPSLPDNTSTRWTKGTNATITESGGATGPEGTIVSSRVTLGQAGTFIRNTTTGQSGYEHAVYVMKGTAGQIVDVNLTPAQAATPNNTVRWTFTGGWDVVPIQAILAGNSSMQLNIINPSDVAGQASITFDVAYAGLSKAGSGTVNDKAPAPFPTTSAAATSAADVIQLTVPAAATTLIYTFDDGSKQSVTVTAGATYSIPTTAGSLTRRLIKSMKFL